MSLQSKIIPKKTNAKKPFTKNTVKNKNIPSPHVPPYFAPAIKDCLGNALSLAGILVTRGAVKVGSLGTTKLQVAKPSANSKARRMSRRAMAVIGMSEETKCFRSQQISNF